MKYAMLIAAALLLSACAGMQSANNVVVDADQPHAMLMHLEAGDVTETVYPAVFIRVDGEPIADNGSRKFVPIKPGKRTIRVSPNYEAILEYQPIGATYGPVPSIRLEEENITLDLQAGMTYKIGVRREGTSWAGFTPILVKAWPTGTPEPQPED